MLAQPGRRFTPAAALPTVPGCAAQRRAFETHRCNIPLRDSFQALLERRANTRVTGRKGNVMKGPLRSFLAILLSTSLAACVTTAKEQLPLPNSWAQKPEERGKLQVGTVVAIIPWQSPDPVTTPGVLTGVAAAGVVVPAALIASPAVLAVCALQEDHCENAEQYGVVPDANGNAFRHVVRLTGSDKEIVKDEFWSYRVGDCVALRDNLDMLVPALSDACSPDPRPPGQ